MLWRSASLGGAILINVDTGLIYDCHILYFIFFIIVFHKNIKYYMRWQAILMVSDILPDPGQPIRRDDLGAAYWQGGRRLACAVLGRFQHFILFLNVNSRRLFLHSIILEIWTQWVRSEHLFLTITKHKVRGERSTPTPARVPPLWVLRRVHGSANAPDVYSR